MVVIDSNALVVYILGLMNPSLVETHEKTGIYEKDDFFYLQRLLHNKETVTLPNILTEADNLLNRFKGDYRRAYALTFLKFINKSSEEYIESLIINSNMELFQEIGLTDLKILELSKQAEFLVTSDSKLSDYANCYGIKVIDLVKYRNDRLLSS